MARQSAHRRPAAKTIAAAVVGVVIGSALAMPPAVAVGGDCRSWMQQRSRFLLPDEYRVNASCNSLQTNSQAQGELVRAGPLRNKYTQWFRHVNVVYSSDWGTFGTSTNVQIAPIN